MKYFPGEQNWVSRGMAVLVMTALLLVPFSTTLADQPYATIDASTSGNPCLGTALTISGGGIVSPASDNQIDQYNIQIIWDANDSVNGTQNGISIVTTTVSSPFPYTFVAGPHTYTGTPPATVKIRIYHVGVPGNDSQADNTITVPTCPPNTPPVISGVPSAVTIPEESPYTFTATASDVDTGDTLNFSLS